MPSLPKLLQDTVIKALEEMKALDIVILDTRSQTFFTDSMIICTGTSGRHAMAIAENVIKQLKKKNIVPISIEGMAAGEWILIDAIDCMVHVMQQSARDYYGLESLWHPLP